MSKANMSDFFRKYKGTIIGIVFILAGMLFYLIMQVFNIWTNPQNPETIAFCEHFNKDLLVGEPMSAWSNFYMIIAGMIVIVYYDLVRTKKIKENNKYLNREENMHYLLTYAILVIWVGIASFYMHGARRTFYINNIEIFAASFLDVLSMNMYMSSIAILSLGILFDIKKEKFYILLFVNNIMMIILTKLFVSQLFVVLVIFTFFNEIMICLGIYSRVFKNKGIRQIRRNFILLVIILISFLVSFWIWSLGLKVAPTCDPFSWWQWHAVWHFGNACSMLLIAYYITTEREI